MKWIGGISFSSHVTRKVVIAVAAFILCPCMTIESSAQTASVVLHAMEVEHPDRYLIRRLEDNISSRVARLLIRTFLNPTRSFANLLRGQRPWYRDNRQ